MLGAMRRLMLIHDHAADRVLRHAVPARDPGTGMMSVSGVVVTMTMMIVVLGAALLDGHR